MNARLTTVYSHTDPMQADIVRNLLRDHHIDAVVTGDHQAGFTGTLNVEVQVRESDAKLAHAVMRDHHVDEATTEEDSATAAQPYLPVDPPHMRVRTIVRTKSRVQLPSEYFYG